MSDASSEARAKASFLKPPPEKFGVTRAVSLIGQYCAFTETLARKLQTVGVNISSVESLIFSSPSVFDQGWT